MSLPISPINGNYYSIGNVWYRYDSVTNSLTMTGRNNGDLYTDTIDFGPSPLIYNGTGYADQFNGPAAIATGPQQTLPPNGQWLQLNFTTANYNINNNYDRLTSRFTCTVPGYYYVNFSGFAYSDGYNSDNIILAIFKNNGEYKRQIRGGGWHVNCSASSIVELSVNDFIDIRCIVGNSTTRTWYIGATSKRFSVILLRGK